ncbi:MAG: PBSX family phage terminase large subunit, partial [Clostridia bacterium]|nr:PBSX family phage terminase large subunit [Clostridia bacterium]
VIDGEFTYNPRHRYYVSVDYGTVNPFAAGLYDYSPAERKATMIKELYFRGGSKNRVDNEAYYKMLKSLIGDYRIEYIIIDPSAASMIETIQKYGEYSVIGGNNDVLNGIQDVTKFLNSDVLFFSSQCTNTFDEFEAYIWDEESEEDKVIKENDHSMDQLRYFCRTALRNELKWIV